MNKTAKLCIASAIVVVLVLVGWVVWEGREADERATVTINDQVLPVRVADNPWERRRGLSGLTTETLKAQGMVFVFPKSEVQNFWMKDMKFPLDVVWIENNRVADLDENIPAPRPGEAPARMSSNPVPVNMVLELPAGSAQHFGISPGTLLKIDLP